MRPAEFARLVGVTKQAVSDWIKRGKITLGPDGKLDPDVAMRQVVERTDPARLRAKALKGMAGDLHQLRQRVAELEAELANERETSAARAADAALAAELEMDAGLTRMLIAICERFDEASAAHSRDGLYEWLEEMLAVEVYGADLAEYRADRAAEG